jgi:TetR/AcrR family transcriptional regulator
MSVPSKRKKPGIAAVRDPGRTRRRILAAALKEFSTSGFAGARVGGIARHAQVNKRMLYHYFGNKENLFREMLRDKLASRRQRFDTYSADLVGGLPLLFEQNHQDADWVRLLGWESLQAGGGRVQDEAGRRRRAAATNALIRRQQAAGKIMAGIKPEHFHLVMASLAIFPVAFRQLTRIITGKSAAAPVFQRDYARFLKQVAATFRPHQRRVKKNRQVKRA